jgi:hypothetical protein
MTTRVLILGAFWFALSFVLGAMGVIATLRPPAPQIVVAALTAALLVAFWKGAAFRAWIMSLPLPALLLPHGSRFVGFYFLVLHARGELPYAFAVPGGWGDIITATTGLALVFAPPQAPWRDKAWLAWNIFGLIDIPFVVVTAARLALADPHSMGALLRLPLNLLPTFFVPLIIATHVMLFARLRAAADTKKRTPR